MAQIERFWIFMFLHMCWIENTINAKIVRNVTNRAKIWGIWVKSSDFWIFMFLHMCCEFDRDENFFDLSQIFCPGKFSWISQSTLSWIENTGANKQCIIHENRSKTRDIWTQYEVFGFSCFFVCAVSLTEMKTFLTSLRFFVQENFLGSRRAHCPGSKTLVPKTV